MNDSSLVAAATFTNIQEANIVLGMLRAHDIPCILEHETLNSVFGIQLAPNDGIRLMVFQRDLQRTQELMEEDHD